MLTDTEAVIVPLVEPEAVIVPEPVNACTAFALDNVYRPVEVLNV